MMGKLHEQQVTGTALRRRFEKLDNHDILDILHLQPTMVDVDEALAWDNDTWEGRVKQTYPLKGCAGQDKSETLRGGAVGSAIGQFGLAIGAAGVKLKSEP